MVQRKVANFLNPAYKKVPVNKAEMDKFLAGLDLYLKTLETPESEEHYKAPLRDLLNDVYYKDRFAMNTKGRADFVIFNGKADTTTAGVLIETKAPGNADMVTEKTLDKKSMHELMLYYMRERIDHNNNELKHLIITDFHHWFVFDASDFYNLIYQNTTFRKQYNDWNKGQTDSEKTNSFYKDIASPFIRKVKEELPYAYFDIRKYPKASERKQVSLYKMLSPEHLLKQSFANDSNTLNRVFYNELLHLIGLEEEGKGKKVINRKAEDKRNPGSMLENAIHAIERDVTLTKVGNLYSYGSTNAEQRYTIALELCITWINRILFLKLLEAQLYSYHDKDDSYKFLNSQRIPDWDQLNKLFFDVLAVKPERRHSSVADYDKVPYLNSSLFERTELEDQTILISQLDNATLPYRPGTVLDKTKDDPDTLTYLFRFLDAYDFSSEGKEKVIKEKKNLINASVLGLIFEKINGYKDGSFFTPGFITMYMCRETLRRAVVQKFNEAKGWQCETFTDLKNKDFSLKEANDLINSLKIIDPAVGSGHFLVSALNELIVIKHELGVLMDAQGVRLKYNISVQHDELHVEYDDGELFEYKIGNKESQRVQETLFHEKQTLIENCLFGVDINPNSVKICRLRLWIELLKHAYYSDPSLVGGTTKQSEIASPEAKGDDAPRLETLPNIDINIKTGNSLISRFALDEDLSEVFKKQQFSIATYRNAVTAYKDTNDKDAKAELQAFIKKIKEQFRSSVLNRDPLVKKISETRGKIMLAENSIDLFGEKMDTDKKDWEIKRLKKRLEQLEKEREDQLSNTIYQNAFEWRFEFPEVLDDQGEFVGFDVCIGNPPYVDIKSLKDNDVSYIFSNYRSANNRVNLFSSFIEMESKLIKDNGEISQIIPTAIAFQSSYKNLRTLILREMSILEIVRLPNETFGEAAGEVKVDTLILSIHNNIDKDNLTKIVAYSGYERIDDIDANEADLSFYVHQYLWMNDPEMQLSIYLLPNEIALIEKCRSGNLKLEECTEFSLGITPYDKYKGHTPSQIKNKVFHSHRRKNETFKPLLKGNDVRKYQVEWNGETWISYGSWLGAQRQSKFFNVKRVLVKQIIDWSDKSIWAAVTEEELYNTQNAFNLIPTNGFTAELLCAFLNSRLLSWFHRKVFLDEFKMRFQKILIKDCKLLPIATPSNTQRERIESLVTTILAGKKEEPNADTSKEEVEIDRLVYELYGLTEEEIKIVEQSNL